jgi:hypothetical protein
VPLVYILLGHDFKFILYVVFTFFTSLSFCYKPLCMQMQVFLRPGDRIQFSPPPIVIPYLHFLPSLPLPSLSSGTFFPRTQEILRSQGKSVSYLTWTLWECGKTHAELRCNKCGVCAERPTNLFSCRRGGPIRNTHKWTVNEQKYGHGCRR